MLWVVGSTSIGVLIYLNIRPSYKALSLLRVDPTVTDLYNVRGGSDNLDPYLQTQVQLITSPNVLTAAGTNPKAAVLERIQKAGDVVQELQKAVLVTVRPGTYLIEVAMTSPNGYEAATIVNAVVDAFMDANNEWSDGMTRQQIKNLEQYQIDLKNQTDELERKWMALAAKGDLDVGPGVARREEPTTKGDPNAPKTVASPVESTNRASITIEEYRQIRHELNAVEIDLAQAQAWLAAAKAAAKNGKKEAKEASAAGDQAQIDNQVKRRFQLDPEVSQLLGEIQRADDKLADAKRAARDTTNDAAVMANKRKLEGLVGRYNKLWDVKEPIVREMILSGGDGKSLSPDQEVKEAEAGVTKLLAKQALLKAKYEKLDLKNKTMATDAVQIALIQDGRDTLKSMTDAVTRRLEQLKYEAKGEARIKPVSPNGAMVPTRAISDKRVTFLAATPVGVLGAVLGLIVLLEVRSGRVDDPDLLSSRVRHEVFSIAPLPSIRPGDDVNSEKAEQRLARFVQSLDHLRVAICEGGHAGDGRCVMITSATGGEGKTTLSAHLAARCANSGTSTLLIDADMRRASLGRLLDVPAGPGLVEVLAGEVDLDEALSTVQAGGFHFLSAGSSGRDPSRVLKSARFSELLARARQSYDLIIIDTPPVLPVADALIIGRWVDGAVMAARFDASRLPLVERANRQLAMAGIPVLGVVVNGVKGQDAAYGNYAYNYSYYPAKAGDATSS
jgi:capsular exopolysaccharide synthesis family protein